MEIGKNWLEFVEKKPVLFDNNERVWTSQNDVEWEPHNLSKWIDSVEPFTTYAKAMAAAKLILKDIRFRIVPRETGFVIQFKDNR